MTKTVTVPACSICGGPLYMGNPDWKGGHNAQPINNGRCCDICNGMTVLPTRIANLYRDKSEKPKCTS